MWRGGDGRKEEEGGEAGAWRERRKKRMGKEKRNIEGKERLGLGRE
jgi:hypothetical protein